MTDVRRGMEGEDPLMLAIKLTRDHNPPMWRTIETLVEADNIIENCIETLKGEVRNSQQSKITTYRSLNPNLNVHNLYKNNNTFPDYLRISFTRLRLSSHRLAIETGRWNRIERSERYCSCQTNVQTEEHVLVECPLTEHLRVTYDLKDVDINYMMEEPNVHYLHKALELSEPV